MVDDGALLREYAQSGSEDAFAELVRRHLDLVYSTALRAANGDEPLAKDVCQSVFIDLSRKASRLCNHSVLTGWLYTSACFAAAKAAAPFVHPQLQAVAHRMLDASGAPLSPTINLVINPPPKPVEATPRPKLTHEGAKGSEAVQ